MHWEDNTKRLRWKICAPNSIVHTIFWYLHDTRTAGHLGIKKTHEKAKLSPFYWIHMQESVTQYVNQCEICGERKNPPNKKRHLLKSYNVGVPFERIATDIACPFPITDDNNRYILVVGDYFSKLTEAYPMPDIQAKTVANIIFRAWIKRYGCPMEIHSDQGKQYESTLFKELCTMLEINKTRTTPFHPRSDGMIERMNRSINDMLLKYIKSHQKDWDLCLDFIMMAYNSTPHESTGISPYKLVFSQEMSLPIDIITEQIDEMLPVPKYASTYIQELEERLKGAHDLARKHLKVSAERQKILYNTNVKRHNYEIGDLVWRNQKKKIPGLKLEIARQWTGPWVVVDKKSDIIFKIQHSKNSGAVIIHGDNLKPYRGNKTAKWFRKNNEERIPVAIPDLTEFLSTPDHNENSHTQNPLITVKGDDGVKSTQEEVKGNEMEDVITDSNDSDNIPGEPADNYLDKSPIAAPDNTQSLDVIPLQTWMLHKPAKRGNIVPKISIQRQDGRTRTGRQVKVPSKYQDFVTLIMEENNKNEKHMCDDCGQGYSSKRNLKRHRN
ncbi:unnamed protein product [Mytilus coruscus]|uniref:Integrase catalytic domain-containing protein n=1 Tax=Mytilus coruscus TaxID=42192 RepID=A0A6J8DM37_MYTCO|nr:unnamed protein product [Mytilus coruscus]